MKLKKDIEFNKLKLYGFIEDEANCEEGDHYCDSNNYYYEFNNSYGARFRLVVNILTREFGLLALSEEVGLIQLYELDIFVSLIRDELVEI